MLWWIVAGMCFGCDGDVNVLQGCEFGVACGWISVVAVMLGYDVDVGWGWGLICGSAALL